MFASKDTLLTRPSGYNIARSVRLRSSASAYLNRTPATTSNRKTWTWSGWIKKGTFGSRQGWFSAGPTTGRTDSNTLQFGWFSDNGFQLGVETAYVLQSTQLFRDPAAWYHFVIAFDSTQSTATNRVKVYVNGSEITSWSLDARSSLITQNGDFGVNLLSNPHYLGAIYSGLSQFDGYFSETNFIDGQALTPSSFGETDSITGVWKAKKYGGTYGTNGFYLNFSDNSNNTAATIGKDYSGNGNNWTPNNISVTSGVTYDSMVDSPTVGATSSNYAVINPLLVGDYFASGQTTFAITNGNLNYGATGRNAFGSIAVSSGKWYWEMVNTSNTTAATALFGVVTVASRTSVYGCYYNSVSGNKGLGTLNSGATETSYGATWSDNDVIGVVVDMDAATPTVTFYKNNASQGAISVSSFVGQSVMMWIQNGGNTNNMSGFVNFGQRPFTYTPPTGFVALNTWNLPDSTIKNGAAYMAATVYSGNSPSSQTVSNAVNGFSFQPDLVWQKSRTQTYSNVLYDSVRGVQKRLSSNETAAESTASTAVTAFTSSGFTTGADGEMNDPTGGSNNHVAWQWKAGGTSASNTNGSITSTVSVGATQGFSVVTYTGTQTAATVGHGLGVSPSMIIVKARSNSTFNWTTWHKSFTANGYIYLDGTDAVGSSSGPWNGTLPTSSVFSLGADLGTNKSANTYVAYCFAAVAGYSAFGSYTGNGSTDGPFVYLGFRPRFVMFKDTTSVGAWMIMDTSRNTYNVLDDGLAPNNSNAESSYSNTAQVDFLSNGFKIRADNANSYWNNVSGNTYIYAAFAESPFKTSLAR